jgi:hypothetical protein
VGAPTTRQRASEVGTSGLAPSAERRRGSRSRRGASPWVRARPSEERLPRAPLDASAAEAATAKNRGIHQEERQRELHALQEEADAAR